MYHGSCLCGAITYEIRSEPLRASHCHCTMCQKQHGAAFATYANVARDDLVYLTGLDKLKTYNSSGTVLRRFCSDCGSSLEWSDPHRAPDRVAIAMGTFDTPYRPEHITDLHLDTRACWLPSFLDEME